MSLINEEEFFLIKNRIKDRQSRRGRDAALRERKRELQEKEKDKKGQKTEASDHVSA